jgi:3-hydroxyisobutyrate dehydrogenase-like beta-hydroxyacid dehydrogenase
METLGFVGLGNMGSRMVPHLQKAGYSLVVLDPEPRAGADLVDVRRVGAPAEVSGAAGMILLSLPGPKEVREVTLALVDGVGRDAVVVDLSTSSPALARELGEALAGRGAHFVDAPVTGGVQGAAKASLRIMVGAEPALFERVQPVLKLLGSEVLRMGPCGAGCAAKLVNNTYGFVRQAALVEVLLLAQAAGVDLAAMLAVFRASNTISPGIERKITQQLFRREFSPEFRLELATKDARLAAELAEETAMPFGFGRQVYDLLREADGRGLGDQDVIALATVLEERAGTRLEG